MANSFGQLQYSSMDGNKDGCCDASISGPHKVKNMDIYLEPLIEELKILWRGIQIHDVSRPIATRDAIVKGILMWTMHDYPGYSTAQVSSLSSMFLLDLSCNVCYHCINLV